MRLIEIFERCLHAHYRQAGGVHFAVERAGETLWLFFEHSRDLQDWLYNLDFPVQPYRRMGDQRWYCHRGFLKAWRQVEPFVAAALAARPCRKIITAGYSHGAALAVLCHEYLWFHRPKLRPMLASYGFACPRVIWGRAPQERWAGFTVICNRGDPVSHLPPAALGYRHVGRRITVGEKGARLRVRSHLPEAMLASLENDILLF